jgi:fatty-acyl-CoA synthase
MSAPPLPSVTASGKSSGDVVLVGDELVSQPRWQARFATRTFSPRAIVKSGGEWISTPLLEGALMAHPAVAEAAVIGVPDPKWGERPLAVVTLRPGAAATADELRAFLDGKVARWQVPERIEFTEAIPKTAVGKLDKVALRKTFDA